MGVRRRTLLARLAAGGTGVALGTGTALATGDEPPTIGRVSAEEISLRWEFADGHAEVMTLAAFDRRSDTPSRDRLRARGESVWSNVCCDCPLRRGPDCEENCSCGGETIRAEDA